MTGASIDPQNHLPDGQTQHPPMAIDRRVQIDGLRALAMVGVLYIHFWDRRDIAEDIRVTLFFVISGFLITHILMRAKDLGGQVHVFNFYIRRMLRLLPALAVVITVGLIFDIDGFRDSVLWHIFQSSNIYFAITEEIRPWVVGHLWSLNVLEQFYVLWPLVIFFLPLRQIYGAALALAVIMILLRNHGDLLGIAGWWKYMVFATDPVAVGALFYLMQREAAVAAFIRSWAALGISLLALVSPYLIRQEFGGTETYQMLIQPALGVIVVGAFHGFRGPVGWLLGCAVMQFISKISYSVYVYHLLVWWGVMEITPAFSTKGPLTFFVLSALTGIVATISWYALEHPLSRLKRHFPTGTRGPG